MSNKLDLNNDLEIPAAPENVSFRCSLGSLVKAHIKYFCVNGLIICYLL